MTAMNAADKSRRAHEKKYPEGCRATWSQMCEECCSRIGGKFPAHPAVQAFRRTQNVTETLRRKIADADKAIASFQKSLSERPAMAFEWGRDTVSIACEKEVATQLLRVVEDKGLDVAYEVALSQTINGARWPSHSTSPMSNLASTYMTAAWASFVAQEREYKDFRKSEEAK
jgi:hypothetical protein